MHNEIEVIDVLLKNYEYFICISWEVFSSIEENYVKHNQKAKHRLYHDNTISNNQIEVYLDEISLIQSTRGLIGNYQNILRLINMKAFL